MPELVLALPSTALLLDEVSAGGADDVLALRTAVAHLLAGFEDDLADRSCVVIAPDPAAEGAEAVWLDVERVSLAGLGLPDLWAPAARPADGLPVAGAGAPGPDLAVLALMMSRSGTAPPSLLALPAGLEGDALRACVQHACAAIPDAAVVVCAADLAAGHGPKPPRPDVGAGPSVSFDREVHDAAAADLPDRLVALASEAAAVAARGIPSLCVAASHAASRGLHLHHASTHVTDGVGSLVAAWT